MRLLKVPSQLGWLIVFAVLVFPISGESQWKNIGQLSSHAECGYFFDDQRGLVACGIGDQPIPVAPAVYLTTNGGTSWTTARLPPIPPGDLLYITSIEMKDTSTGWLTIDYIQQVSAPVPGVWATVDGGRNWTPIDGSLDWGGVKLSSTGNLAFAFGNIAFEDNGLIGIGSLAYFTQTSIPRVQRITYDGGNSWAPLPKMENEAWGIAYSKFYKKFYINPEL